jgi:hypothetical protein
VVVVVLVAVVRITADVVAFPLFVLDDDDDDVAALFNIHFRCSLALNTSSSVNAARSTFVLRDDTDDDDDDLVVVVVVGVNA